MCKLGNLVKLLKSLLVCKKKAKLHLVKFEKTPLFIGVFCLGEVLDVDKVLDTLLYFKN